jgi:AraC-like DNA-binding protein
MKPIIFLGPTLSNDEALQVLDAIILAPVAQGDVYRAAINHPPAIGIIDGYFDSVPAVWHKEILWAMAQGIYVFGSSSMGALRAAELAEFGMRGVGWIFESFQNGQLQDDDEVALLHGTAETGYQNLSVPMVNLRCTIAKAIQESVISNATANTCLSIAKDLFYPDRLYPNLLKHAQLAGAPSAEIEALRAWLPTGKIDQKRLDAISMLQAIAQTLEIETQPMHVTYSFNYTDLWEQAIQQAGNLILEEDKPSEVIFGEDLIEELCLNVEQYSQVYEAAILRLLLMAEAQRQGVKVDEESLYNTIVEFRIEHKLLEPEELEKWLVGNHLDQAEFVKIMIETTLTKRIRSDLADRVVKELPNELRLKNHYVHCIQRASKKRLLLTDSPQNERVYCPNTAPDNDKELIMWFLERQPQLAKDLTQSEIASKLGFDNPEKMMQSFKREWLYQYEITKTGHSEV